jgi:hypothetical protein
VGLVPLLLAKSVVSGERFLRESGAKSAGRASLKVFADQALHEGDHQKIAPMLSGRIGALDLQKVDVWPIVGMRTGEKTNRR